MMDTRTLLNRLEACVQEEIRAQERMLGLLARQERAIVENRAGALEEATQAVEREILSSVGRGARREAVIEGLARAFGVPAAAMTLSSIAERAGSSGESLLRLRAELRACTAKVARQNRRVASLTRVHRRLVQDVLTALFQDEVAAASLTACGTLVDAEA
jgi:FlgN protein